MKPMLDVVNHNGSLIFSVKTFRPLWILPWHTSVWRQLPMRTSMATMKFRNENATAAGHRELTRMLTDLDFVAGGTKIVRMADVVSALEQFANNESNGVKSYRIWGLNELEKKINVRLQEKRRESKPKG